MGSRFTRWVVLDTSEKTLPRPSPGRPRRVIKRYSNRKLYDTRDSRYVTLLQIAEMIRTGEEVQIIDNATKEDKTEVTLALIISEELKAQPRSVPLSTLRSLIHERGEKLLSQLREGPIGRLIPGAAEPRGDAEPKSEAAGTGAAGAEVAGAEVAGTGAAGAEVAGTGAAGAEVAGAGAAGIGAADTEVTRREAERGPARTSPEPPSSIEAANPVEASATSGPVGEAWRDPSGQLATPKEEPLHSLVARLDRIEQRLASLEAKLAGPK